MVSGALSHRKADDSSFIKGKKNPMVKTMIKGSRNGYQVTNQLTEPHVTIYKVKTRKKKEAEKRPV